MSQIVDNHPNYTNSRVWQDLMQMKAMHLKENNHSTDAPTSNSLKGNKFSLRTPLNLSKIGSTKGGSDLMERGHATATQFQTTKNTSAGFFPAVSGGL